MFLDNKYTKLYWRIVERGRRRSTILGYVEKHHIIPVSLGGIDDSTNLVILTAKEHYIVHRLLCKMVMGRAKYLMAFAIIQMSTTSKGRPRYIPSSRVYGNLRESLGRIQKAYVASLSKEERSAKYGSMRGRIPSIESNEKRSKALTGRIYTEVHAENISKARMGMKFSDSHRDNLRSSHIGFKPSEETRKRLSLAAKKNWEKRKQHKLIGV